MQGCHGSHVTFMLLVTRGFYVVPHVEFAILCERLCACEGHICKLVCLHAPVSPSIFLHYSLAKLCGACHRKSWDYRGFSIRPDRGTKK